MSVPLVLQRVNRVSSVPGLFQVCSRFVRETLNKPKKFLQGSFSESGGRPSPMPQSGSKCERLAERDRYLTVT